MAQEDLRDFARFVVGLDDTDARAVAQRRTVTLEELIQRAKKALETPPADESRLMAGVKAAETCLRKASLQGIGAPPLRALVRAVLAITDDHEHCGLCRDMGWVLDGSDRDKPGPRMFELISCPVPDCKKSGQPLQSVNFSGVHFTDTHFHPVEGWLMSVSGGAIK